MDDHPSLSDDNEDNLWKELEAPLLLARMTMKKYARRNYYRHRSQSWPDGVRLYFNRCKNKFLVYFENGEALNRWQRLKGRRRSSPTIYEIRRRLRNLR